MIFAALFAAMTCAATFSIKIPTPGTGGYIHPGDAIVILSGVMLGGVYGGLAAGIGSALADLLGGYVLYAPATFVIKGMLAFLSALLFQKLGKNKQERYLAVGLGGVVDILLVAGGYLSYEMLIYGVPGALTSLLPNLIQGGSGLLLALTLYPVLWAVPEFRHNSAYKKVS
jgi:uncharacterized membrane protein